jgi:hypothetical protein
VNGYYKAELIRGPARGGRPWKTVEEVELATLGWVHWHNTQRLHGYLGDLPPVEFEALHASNAESGAADPGDPAAPGKRSWPPAPAGAVTIMCGSPGSAINRSKRRAPIKKEPPT